MRWARCRAWCLAAALVSSACSSEPEAPSDVGKACVPSIERSETYAGSAMSDVMIDSDEGSCGALSCLGYHFQGRLGCPYGQTSDDIESLPADDPARCHTPADDAVIEPVVPQLEGRPARTAVYCSCACAGPDPDAEYCECPSNTQCLRLVPEIAGLEPVEQRSFCIKNGTAFDALMDYGPRCSSQLANCDGETRSP